MIELIVIILIVVVASYVVGQADHEQNAESQRVEDPVVDADSEQGQCLRDARWYNTLPSWKKAAYAAWYLAFRARCGKYL